MRLRDRFRIAVRAWYEAARYRVGRPRIPTTSQDARLDLSRAVRATLQGKAQYWERNFPLISRLADVFECYTVGTGLVANPASSDQTWNDQAKQWWLGWEKVCDNASRQTFGTLQGLIARRWFVDGECFVYLTQGESGKPRLQLIEAHRVGTPPSKAALENKGIADGVEYDTNSGRPLAYWVSRQTEDNNIEWTRIPAEWVIHVFEPSRPGEYRGIPFFSSALNTIDDLDELKRLELKAARAASVVANVIKTASGEFDYETLIQNGGSATADSTTNEVTAYQERLGGETIALKPGEELEQFRSDRPSVITREYWRDLQAEVCASAGIPSVLAYPEQMQGTQYRGALDMAATFFNARSSIMQDVVRRIYAWAIGKARQMRELPQGPSDFWRISVRAPRAVNVDVGRNSTAMLQELAAGVTTYDAIYSPLGLDWRVETQKLADEREYLKEIGIISTGGGDVQVTALNGAQVASVLSVVQQVSQKLLSGESAKQMLYIALPTTDSTLIDKMVDEAVKFTPAVQPVQEPQQPAQPQDPTQ